ncbi:uncharacterized protein LOC111031715 isoform X1 [Myzus persicae]|uniref:uncharacterized protein LOC111031715 isoform X1 n=1 Tax=Myzus persicae TaxID=13164 RepID=UPI000B930505|nr:uncharacterized protein LOC111031715 isoform X1 [Myzus persicae]
MVKNINYMLAIFVTLNSIGSIYTEHTLNITSENINDLTDNQRKCVFEMIRQRFIDLIDSSKYLVLDLFILKLFLILCHSLFKLNTLITNCIFCEVIQSIKMIHNIISIENQRFQQNPKNTS